MADRTFLDYTNSGEQPNIWTNGFNLQDVDSMGTLTWTNSTRTVALAVKSGESSFVFWCDGKKYSKTTTQSCVIPDTTGLYYVYFDNDGNIQSVIEGSVTGVLFNSYAIVALVYWNATTSLGRCGEERHGIDMSAATHMSLHLSIGARYQSGIDIEGLSDGSATYTQTTAGHFWDEDIQHTVSTETTHPFLYRIGATGEWTTATADNKIGYNAGSGDYKWNQWTGTTWQLAVATSSTDYFMTFFVASPDLTGNKVLKIIGHAAYSSRAKARAAIESEVNQLKLDGLPSAEIVFLYAVICKRNGTLEDLADGSTYYNLRQVKGGGGTSNSASAGSDISLDTSNFTGCLSATDTDTQTAIESLMTAVNNTVQVS